MTPAELSRTVLRSVRGAVEERELSVAVPARIVVQPPPRPGCGDYASNIALQLAKPAGRPAREVAEILRKRLAGSAGIARVEIAGPGFLNFTLGDGALAGLVREVLARGAAYGELGASGELRVSGDMDRKGDGASAPVAASAAASVGSGARGLVVAEVLARIGAAGGQPAGPGEQVAGSGDGSDGGPIEWPGEGAVSTNCPSVSGFSPVSTSPSVSSSGPVSTSPSVSASGPVSTSASSSGPASSSRSVSTPGPASTPTFTSTPAPAPASPSALVELAGLVARLGSDEARWVLLRPAAQDPVRVPERPAQREENPRFRVQYAYARTRAMVRNAGELGFAGEPGEVMAAGNGPAASGRPHDPEGSAGGQPSRTLQALRTCLATYPSATESALRLGAPDRLVRHLEATADAWLRCQEEFPPLPVGEEKPLAVHRARLALAEAAGTVLGNGLRLLGISAPEYV
ncbi:hypothetical protein GCM10010211_03590 [Streptomyces albospinus]|uniref:arginine--tRNA ligase n=1 Tax=Streptomyces albospinus TaxID=285515 RepID=A0ABQ2ULU0_9ACTN|nr:DALR anticodon-binding domain-containing protein [Streptomyces albospinus]GGU43452.1 hypothetical protein GCM10010211_03590 [Streptomyces albospinus]